MAQIHLKLPDGRTVSLSVQDGLGETFVQLRECACPCAEWFQPAVPHQNFVNETHQKLFNNRKRTRKTLRRKKIS